MQPATFRPDRLYFDKQFVDYYNAGYPYLAIGTHEETLVVARIVNMINDPKLFHKCDKDGRPVDDNNKLLDLKKQKKEGTHTSERPNLFIWDLVQGLNKVEFLPKQPGEAQRTVITPFGSAGQLKIGTDSPTAALNNAFSALNAPPEENLILPLRANKKNSAGQHIPPAIILFTDPHLILDTNVQVRNQVIRFFKHLKDKLSATGSMCVFLDYAITMPPEIERGIQMLNYPLPTKHELREMLVDMIEGNKEDNEELKSIKFDISDSKSETEVLADGALDGAIGLGFDQAANAFALGLRKGKGFNQTFVNTVFSEKITHFEKAKLMTHIDRNIKLEDIGGNNKLKAWVQDRRYLFTQKATDYGVATPQGILLCGLPGGGKTIFAQGIANELNCPLFKLDLGSLFGSRVGESEQNLRRVLDIIDSMGRVVVLIDEVEKYLNRSIVESSGDSGTASRIFGTFLHWSATRTSKAFIVATSNNHMILPDALIRRGRFDALFWIDLPNASERKDIWNVQLKRRNSDKNNILKANCNLNKLVELSEGFTGAEIESCVKDALVHCFNEFNGDHKQFASSLYKATENLVPDSEKSSDFLEELRKNAIQKLQPAN